MPFNGMGKLIPNHMIGHPVRLEDSTAKQVQRKAEIAEAQLAFENKEITQNELDAVINRNQQLQVKENPKDQVTVSKPNTAPIKGGKTVMTSPDAVVTQKEDKPKDKPEDKTPTTTTVIEGAK